MALNELIIRLIGDSTSLVKSNEAAISSNTLVGKSALEVGASYEKSAAAQVAAISKSIAAQKSQIAANELAMKSLSGDTLLAMQTRTTAMQERLNRQLGIAPVAVGKFDESTKTAERDLGKLVRGGLAGSGVFAALGRSLAFASTGFIAIAGGATLLHLTIQSALDLAAAQRKVNTQLETGGKSWAQYGDRINKADDRLRKIAGFSDTDLLTSFGYLFRASNNVGTSLKFQAVAADVARGRNISLASASIALSKALGGSLTALRRLGITIPVSVKGMDALNYVAEKFRGQAQAGTTTAQRLAAQLQHAGEVAGTVLLPTFERLTVEFTNWIEKLTKSGELQRDVTEGVHLLGLAFHAAEGFIHGVDKVTGGFLNTLELLAAFEFSKVIYGWVGALDALIVKWGAVRTAAISAEAAEATGAGVAGAAGAAAGAAAGGAATGAALGLSALVAPVAVVGAGAFLLSQSSNKSWKLANGGEIFEDGTGAFFITRGGRSVGISKRDAEEILGREGPSIAGPPVITPGLRAIGSGGTIQPGFFGGVPSAAAPSSLPVQNPFPVLTKWTGFQLTIIEQVQQAQAALTKSTADDVRVAKGIIDRIKVRIASGGLTEKGYLAALQLWAQALGTIQSAEQAAAQKRAAAAAKALQIASTFTTSIDLQIAQVQAEMTKSTADDKRVLKEIIAEAKAALASGKKNKQGRLAALQVILQAQQALDSLTGQTATNYTLPAKLQLALAKAQATGQPIVPVLLKMKAALERALKAAKGNIQKQTDIYNQIYAINQQLGQGVNDAYGDFKQANLKKITGGLGLTADQRRREEERIARLGPGGTVPRGGTTAGGYVIDPSTGRPIHLYNRGSHRGGSNFGYSGPPGGVPHVNIDLNVYLDGKHIEASVTPRQQKTRRRNPSSRRGPNAATAAA